MIVFTDQIVEALRAKLRVAEGVFERQKKALDHSWMTDLERAMRTNAASYWDGKAEALREALELLERTAPACPVTSEPADTCSHLEDA